MVYVSEFLDSKKAVAEFVAVATDRGAEAKEISKYGPPFPIILCWSDANLTLKFVRKTDDGYSTIAKHYKVSVDELITVKLESTLENVFRL